MTTKCSLNTKCGKNFRLTLKRYNFPYFWCGNKFLKTHQ